MRKIEFQLDRKEVLRLMEPYLAQPSTGDLEGQWQQLVHAKNRKAVKRLWGKRLLGWLDWGRRGQTEIETEYSASWRRKRFEKYDPEGPKPETGEPWEWGDARVLMSGAGGARVRLAYLMRVIAQLEPKSVLEVGFGNGVNLLPLSCRFPEISFSGLELTEGGYETASSVVLEAELPKALRQFSPEPVVDASAHRTLKLVRGSAARLPFPDGSFDLVFTSLALEQMEEIRPQALAEITRVTRRFTLFLEPFAEYNNRGLPRNYVKAWDYFQGAIADLSKVGLEVQGTWADMPSEAFLKPCLVFAQKQ